MKALTIVLVVFAIYLGWSAYLIHKQAVKMNELIAYIEREDTNVTGFITCYHYTGPYRCGYLRDKKQKP